MDGLRLIAYLQKNQIRLAAVLLAMCVVLAPVAGKAAIYRYVDEKGNIHLTNVPGDPRYRLWFGEEGRRGHGRSQFDSAAFDDSIHRAARYYGLDPLLVKAIIKIESNFNRHAVSEKGAMGLMQLMPETASDMKVANPYDPEENIFGGTCYLSKLIDMFAGDLKLSLAAYNAGPERVKKEGGVPEIPETRDYVRKVLACYQQYQRKEKKTSYD